MMKEISVTGLIAAWFLIKKWLGEISKVVEPLCKEVEKMAIDGVIDKADRKALVMKAITLLEENKKIKLRFITRLIISKVVDKIASKLPDFTITKESRELLTKAS